ncbi:MAG: hypothetical protein Ct9H90mP3_5730 [Flammeovirgaceae bacterium]|nr:MAG: hypothetical protein Ct9H90mP3_5730 [Flammeovirgaceae bacterium]
MVQQQTPDFEVVSYAGSQVKNAIDATIKLKGENYVFWGGREGYMTLLNTDMKKELDNLATFLHMAKIMVGLMDLKDIFLLSLNQWNHLNISMILMLQLLLVFKRI